MNAFTFTQAGNDAYFNFQLHHRTKCLSIRRALGAIDSRARYILRISRRL